MNAAEYVDHYLATKNTQRDEDDEHAADDSVGGDGGDGGRLEGRKTKAGRQLHGGGQRWVEETKILEI